MESSLDIGALQAMVTESEEATQIARKRSERDRDYVDGKQLTSEEIATLKRRGQPPVVINRIRRKVEWLQGLEIKQRTDPRAFPRTPEHEEGAEAATDAIRFVCDNVDWDTARTAVYDDMLVEGFGGVEVLHRQTPRGDVEIEIKRVPWDRLIYDPHSREPDFTDARYLGSIVWSDVDDLKRDHPKHAQEFDGLIKSEQGQETSDDRPKHTYWTDAKRGRVKICLLWYRKDDAWYWCKFAKGIKLDGGVSPYQDEDGNPSCPMVLQSAYVDRDNCRYGIVRDMIDMQDEINKRRSKALHNFVARQVLMSKGTVKGGSAEVRRQMARPDGVIEYEGDVDDRFEVLPNTDLASGHVALYQDAKIELDQIGASGDLGGDESDSQSGRAILAKQQAGMIGVGKLTDSLSHLTRRVFRMIWMRIRQFWTAQRWIRVTDNESNLKFVGLNQPVTLRDVLGQMDEMAARDIAYRMGLRPGDPRLNAVVEIKNNVVEMDVDILIEEAPDRITLQGEAFEAMLKYAQSGAIPPDVLIEADPTLPTQKKEKLLELLEQSRAQQAQMAQPVQELEMADKQADIAKKQAEAQAILQPQPTAAGF